MKTVLTTILTLTFFACVNKQEENNLATNDSEKRDTVIIHDTIFIPNDNARNWQEGFGLTHNPDKDSIWFKPASYYLSDKECSGLARDFYYGELCPSDNGMTDELLKLATTDNIKLRPFYRWCLNKTIALQDGALGEHIGIPARKYAEKFPKEFFEYIDIDTDHGKYNDWLGSIEYSGFYDIDDYKNPKAIELRMLKTMKANCKNCDSTIIKRIEKFAKECFD